MFEIALGIEFLIKNVDAEDKVLKNARSLA